eukprot:6488116-Amphidinium_carterae.1
MTQLRCKTGCLISGIPTLTSSPNMERTKRETSAYLRVVLKFQKNEVVQISRLQRVRQSNYTNCSFLPLLKPMHEYAGYV